MSQESLRPLLTLAIPTYNRCECLRQLLDGLFDQIPTDGSVELLVSDNASVDETAAVVEQAQRKGLQIEYLRNSENLGPDGNFLSCYERARGKYFWVFGDDDLFRPGALSVILRHLRRDEYDLVYVSSMGFTGAPPALGPVLSGTAGRTCTDAVNFVRHVHIFTTLISANIINKDRVEEIGHESFAPLRGSHLTHLAWTFTLLREHRKSLIIEQELFYYRLGNTGGYGICKIFGPNLSSVAHEWLRTPLLVRMIVNASLQRMLPGCLLAINRNGYGEFFTEDPRAVLSEAFSKELRYWVFDYPIIVLPSGLAWVWFQLLRIFNRIDRACGYPSLGW